MSEKPKRPRPAPTPTNITKPFWDGVKEHRFLLQYDPEARRYQFYPRAASIYTGKRNIEWKEVTGNGAIYSWTETYVAFRGFEGQTPYLIACVELDEGVRLMSLLRNCTASDVHIGMRVRLIWETINTEFEYFAFEPNRAGAKSGAAA